MAAAKTIRARRRTTAVTAAARAVSAAAKAVAASKRTATPTPAPDLVLGAPKRNPLKIREGAAYEDTTPREGGVWKLPDVFPGVLPKGINRSGLAMDSWSNSAYGWAMNGAFAEGLEFMGYPYLSELTQRAEYRRPAEIIAKAMTRKWIQFQAKGDEDKSDRIKQLEDAFIRYEVKDRFFEAAQQDGFFGRSQIYLDTGHSDKPEELRLPLPMIPEKIGSNGLLRLTVVEPIWTYPNAYNSTNPLQPDFFVPRTWFVMGQEVHKDRLLTFVSRKVPDILKPAYSFGGLSLSQMAKPYVDNWLRSRQSVSDLIRNYSITVLKTNMSEVLNGGGAQEMFRRIHMFNRTRDNRGLMVVDKEMEDLVNVSTSLASLDKLQAQAQEHMATVYGIPLIILFAITPSGLNASSDAELEVFRDWVLSQQEALFSVNLKTVMHAIMLSIWCEVDPDITFKFEPLEQQDILEIANVRKVEAETDATNIESGIITPGEARTRLAGQDDSPYPGLDVDAVPAPPAELEGGDPTLEGLMGGGSTPAPAPSEATPASPGAGAIPSKPVASAPVRIEPPKNKPEAVRV